MIFLRNNKKLILGLVISFIVGFFSYGLFVKTSLIDSCNSKAHIFINPELDCINFDDVSLRIHEREVEVKEYIDSAISLNKARRVSVFFRDFKSKKWFGINQLDNFSPGSILKLPIAIAYYKLAEIDQNFLLQEIVYKSDKKSLNDLQYFKTAEPLINNQRYSLKNLIDRMIIDSDNDVVPLLLGNINPNFYEKVMLDLGVRIPLAQDGGVHADFFSASAYSAMLRSLFNSSYLNLNQSENILNIMSKSTFTQGLVAGLPKDIKVAHKFGEAVAVDSATNKVVKIEMHDCGIVYKKDNPYIICVMTEGSKFEDLTKIISDISSIVWKD